MTSEELKKAVSMREVVESYGIPVKRNGMCSCPFHGEDRHPSMYVGKDFYFCHSCHASGDIFAFTQQMESCDFKTAFIQLGGTYQHEEAGSRFARYHAEKRREAKERRKSELEESIKLNNKAIHESREKLKQAEPYSDVWCDLMNKYQTALAEDERLQHEREEVNKWK